MVIALQPAPIWRRGNTTSTTMETFSVGVLVCMCANWDYMLLLVTLKNFDVCTVTMSVQLQWELIGFSIDCIDYVLNRDWKHNTNSRIAPLHFNGQLLCKWLLEILVRILATGLYCRCVCPKALIC